MSLPFPTRRAGGGLPVFSLISYTGKVAEMLRLVLNGDSEVLKKLKFVGMIIWGEIDGLLLSRNCLINIGKVTKPLKPTAEGGSEAFEICKLVRVIIWGKSDGLLLSHDCLIDIGKVAKTPKPTLEGDSEVIEK